MRAAYAHAIERGRRFYSYGDGSLPLPRKGFRQHGVLCTAGGSLTRADGGRNKSRPPANVNRIRDAALMPRR